MVRIRIVSLLWVLLARRDVAAIRGLALCLFAGFVEVGVAYLETNVPTRAKMSAGDRILFVGSGSWRA